MNMVYFSIWITVILYGLPWNWIEIILSFLRLHPNTAFRTLADFAPRPSTGPRPMGQDPCLTPWIFLHFLEVKIKISRCMQSTSITQACPTRISLYSASTWAWAPCSWVHYIFLCFCNLSFYFLRLDCSASFSCLSKPPLIIQSPFQIALTLIWYFLAQSSVTILWQPVRTFILHSQLASPILPSKTFFPLIQTPN